MQRGDRNCKPLLLMASRFFSSATQSQGVQCFVSGVAITINPLLKTPSWGSTNSLKSPLPHVSDSKNCLKYHMTMSFVFADRYKSRQALEHIQLVQVTSQKFSAASRSQATNSLKYNFLSNFWLLLRQMPWKVLQSLKKSPSVHVPDSKMRSKHRMSMSFVLSGRYESKKVF